MMGNIWCISDTHFGHSNIIQYTGRPFNSTEEMDETLIANWNAVVDKDDIVIHCGDFGFLPRGEIAKYIARLNGNIILILGNHDTRFKPQKWEEWGIKKAFFRPQVWRGRAFSHEPNALYAQNDCFIHYYGHTHDKSVIDDECCRCVCVEQTNYEPILLCTTIGIDVEDVIAEMTPLEFYEKKGDF